ncbi:MAG: tetratricopeptide repeat protein [Gemmatimonadaceae bacterium]
MIAWRKAAPWSAALTLIVGGSALAQDKCELNFGGAYQLTSATQYLAKGQSGKPDEQPRHLRNAIDVLTKESAKIKNQSARNFILGQVLTSWALRPGVPSVVRRADIGYTTNPNEMIDLYAAIDTAFSVVETTQPGCAFETRRYRGQIWTPSVNAAAAFINSDQLDSADAALARASRIWSGSPLPYYYKAVILQKRNDVPGAIKAYLETVRQIPVDLAAKDSNMLEIRQQSMYNAALFLQSQADDLQGEAKAAKMKEAAAQFQAYVDQYPEGPSIANARTGLARALGASGDTAAVASVFVAMLQSPSSYSDIQLFEAGTAAFRAERKQDAAKLFEYGLQQNPYYRDALYNLANTYFATEQYDKMIPVVRKLTEADPNYPDNWRLLAGAYQRLAAKADAKTKKAQLDSVVKYYGRFQKATEKVSFVGFVHAGAKHTLTGSVENLTAKPATYNITFEFLDKEGKVVASQVATVSVPAKGKSDFKVEVSQPGIVAFRYKPIS